jgi:hypothetical protein
VFQPDVFQPDVFQPDVFQPDVFQPDVFQLELVVVAVRLDPGCSGAGATPIFARAGAPANRTTAAMSSAPDVAPVTDRAVCLSTHFT